jgi:hypothetical protein
MVFSCFISIPMAKTKARLSVFIVQASITIVTYNGQNIFIVQATGHILAQNDPCIHFVHQHSGLIIEN